MTIKKPIKISLIVLAVIVEIVILRYYVLQHLKVLNNGLDYLSKKEIVEVLTDNWDLFNETAEDLKPLMDDENVRVVKIKPGLWILNTDKIKLKHFLLLDVSLDLYLDASNEDYKDVKKEDLPEEKFERLNNSNAYKILRKLDFQEISYEKTAAKCIYFNNRSGSGFKVSLVYTEIGKPDIFRPIKYWEHIKGNWYYSVEGYV